MLNKDDVIYYKAQLEKLFKQAKKYSICIDVNSQLNCVSFSHGIECASAYVNSKSKEQEIKDLNKVAKDNYENFKQFENNFSQACKEIGISKEQGELFLNICSGKKVNNEL